MYNITMYIMWKNDCFINDKKQICQEKKGRNFRDDKCYNIKCYNIKYDLINVLWSNIIQNGSNLEINFINKLLKHN